MRTGGLCVLGAGDAGAGDGAGGRRRERSDEAPDRKLGMPPGCDDTERMLCCCSCERRALVTITSDSQSAASGFTFSVGCESFRGCPAMRDAAVEAAADVVGVMSIMSKPHDFRSVLGNYFAKHASEDSIATHSRTYDPSRVLHESFSMLDDN